MTCGAGGDRRGMASLRKMAVFPQVGRQGTVKLVEGAGTALCKDICNRKFRCKLRGIRTRGPSPMWLLSNGQALTFLAIVAVMVAVSLMLLA